MSDQPERLPEGWKILSSEYLFREDWLTVRRDKVELPDGYVIPRYFVLEYPAWVNILARTKDGQFLLVRQFRYALGETSYELCAGVMDEKDASPLDAAKRELLEETGYSSEHWENWMLMSPNPATSNNWVHCFLAHDVEQTANPSPEPSEKLSVHLFSEEQVLDKMNNGSIIQAMHLAPLWKYFFASATRK